MSKKTVDWNKEGDPDLHTKLIEKVKKDKLAKDPNAKETDPMTHRDVLHVAIKLGAYDPK